MNLPGSNRRDRRKKANRADARGFIRNAFIDRIAWVSARRILERVSEDPAYPMLHPELRKSLGTFLARHPMKGEPEVLGRPGFDPERDCPEPGCQRVLGHDGDHTPGSGWTDPKG